MSIKGNWSRHGSEVVIRWCQRFFLAASRLDFAASPLNSVAPNEKKTSGTQGMKGSIVHVNMIISYDKVKINISLIHVYAYKSKLALHLACEK